MATEKTRQKVQKAFLELLREKRWDEIHLAQIAMEAGIDLKTLRDCYDGKLAIYAGFMSTVDKAVLSNIDDAMAEETPKDRLFDILMSRFDELASHKSAIRNVIKSSRRDPGLALSLNRLSKRSMKWMLEAAGISFSGGSGQLKLQGVVLSWVRVLNIWLDDEDAGYSKTMAALDRELERGSDAVEMVDRITALGGGLRSFIKRVRSTRKKEEQSDEPSKDAA